MGIFGKLMFWRKNDEIGLDNLGLNPQEPAPMQQPVFPDNSQQPWMQPQVGQPSPYYPQQQMESLQTSNLYAAGKQMEVVSAKLDALKASLDSLSQRMANIERMMQGDDYFRRKGW